MKYADLSFTRKRIKGLTPKQRWIWRFMLHYQLGNQGLPPSFSEIMEATGITSPNGVRDIMQRIVKSGKVTQVRQQYVAKGEM